MTCNRKTAVIASLGFGATLAWMAVDAPVHETPITGRAARGAGGFINGVVEVLGSGGAAVMFIIFGVLLAIISAAICPSARS